MTGTEWNLDRTHRSSSGEVRWAALGAPDAPPVVLLHGTPFSSYVWRGPARALAGRHRVFVWDMPGYGASEKRAGQDVSLAAPTPSAKGRLAAAAGGGTVANDV